MKLSFYQESILFLFLLFRGMAAPLLAQDVGFAYFALLSPKFPCDQALKAFEGMPRPALAVLWKTFGDDVTCLKRWDEATRGRPRVLEIHLSNEACRRNRRCQSDELLPAYSVYDFNRALVSKDPTALGALEERVKQVKALVAELSPQSTEFILSTGLEDNYSQPAYEILYQSIRPLWPYKIVRSPVRITGADRGAADYLELHGSTPPLNTSVPCIANLDGEDIEFPHRAATLKNKVSWKNTEGYLKKFAPICRVTFLWSALWQGIFSETRFIVPKERTFVVGDQDLVALKGVLH